MEYSALILEAWDAMGDFICFSAGIATAIILIISAIAKKFNPPRNI
jgi:hypothetical protein